MTDSPGKAPPARECGECTLCCKLMGVKAISKAANTWCTHCTASGGCAIYDVRPQECRDFVCAWLQNPALDERWKPSLCKFVVFSEKGPVNLMVTVDPARPDAWRKEPFYSHFKAWIGQRVMQGGRLLVLNGKRVTAVLPDSDVDLGVWDADERIVISCAQTPFGSRFAAQKIHKDDPRAQGAAGG